MKEKPDLYSYEDYRAYLRDAVEHLKATQASFSFRFFAKKAGFGSTGFLKLVIDGQRSLTPASIQKFIKGFRLNKQEADFFEHLVLFNQAKSTEEKTRYYERMAKHKRYQDIKGIEKDQFEYISHWYFPAIRELLTLPDFKEDPDWIAKTLKPSITSLQAERALGLLFRLKLIRRDESGKLVQEDQNLSTGPLIQALAVKKFLREVSEQAVASMDTVAAKEREMGCVTVGIPLAKLPELKSRIFEFANNFMSSVASTSESIDRIYQLNVQFFPVSEKKK